MIKKISLKKFLQWVDTLDVKTEIITCIDVNKKIHFSCCGYIAGDHALIYTYNNKRETAEKFIAETAAKGYKIRQLPK